jgi:hypothetical protein
VLAAGFHRFHSFPDHGPQILSETGEQPTIHSDHFIFPMDEGLMGFSRSFAMPTS